jgi:TatD DNase family protein
MIDSHAHLDDPEFDADREAAIARARAAGVEAILCVGTTLASSLAAVRLAETHADVYAAIGVHPNSCAEAGQGDWEAIAALAEHPRVVALGETGLDRHWNFAPLELQIEWFRRHLRLGRQTGLPVIIHCRDAAADLLPLLQEGTAAGRPALLMHAFSGDKAMAVKCLELGMFLSFAGNATYGDKKFQSLRAAAAAVPADRILIETDCPYLTPEPLRGKQRNEPALVAHTAACLAGLRGVSVAQFVAETTANARRLFGRMKKEG